MYQAPKAALNATPGSSSSTSATSTIVLLGEAPGADEERQGRPFVGLTGKLLRETLLPEANLDADSFHILNTFVRRPPDNNLDLWTATKTDWKKQNGFFPPQAPTGTSAGEPLGKKRYLLPEHYWQLVELDRRLNELKPDLIIAMGSTALWAISGQAGISNQRGNFFDSRYGRAIATYHPSAVARQWSFRPLVWADLNKVRCWIDGTLPAPLKRKLWINPSFSEIANVYALFNRNPSWLLGVDIETSPSTDQITCISFATATEGICIPIWTKDGGLAASGQTGFDDTNYWSLDDEVKAWRWIARFAQLPNPKVLQNGLYDCQYLLDAPIDIRLRNAHDDTAVMMHAYQPELPKALGTLSSLFLNEPSWKQMRTSVKDENKADD
jgi:uracil-DNA glycosylase